MTEFAQPDLVVLKDEREFLGLLLQAQNGNKESLNKAVLRQQKKVRSLEREKEFIESLTRDM